MFTNKNVSKSDFVRNAQLERQKRLHLKKQQDAVVKIQAVVRMFIEYRKFRRKIREEFDVSLQQYGGDKLPTALLLFSQAKKLLHIFDVKIDEERLLLLCKLIIGNMEKGRDPKYWYMSVILMKDWTVLWINHLKKLLLLCAGRLKTIKCQIQSGSKAASTYLTMLVIFTECSNWKILKIKGGDNIKPVMQQLCVNMMKELNTKGLLLELQDFLTNGLTRKEIALSKLHLTASTTLLIRSLQAVNESSSQLLFVTNILTVPAYIYHLHKHSDEGYSQLKEFGGYSKALNKLNDYYNMAIVYSTLDANQCLCLMGNLIDLCMMHIEEFQKYKDQFKLVVCGLVKHCQIFIGKHSGNSKWHPLLGWYKDNSTNKVSYHDAVHYVLVQLKQLWKQPLVGKFFENLPSIEESESMIQSTSSSTSEQKGGLLRRAFLKAFKKSSNETVDLNEPIVMDVCVSCDLYRTLTSSLSQVRLEIVAGLSLQEEILVRLWRFIYSLGPGAGLKTILQYVNGTTKQLPKPLTSLLVLFCECSAQLIPILDDSEFYEEQKPFTIDDVIKMSSFLNSLVFKLIWNEQESSKGKQQQFMDRDDTIRDASLELLAILYNRDNRRNFTPPNHWLIKELRLNQFHNELKEKKTRALNVMKYIPHILPRMERVKIFHRWIVEDKRSLGIDKELSRASVLLTINRNRLLEDGYDQLRNISATRLKGIIRVRFVNEQGLDEAGIDQDGVFKEFLEDVIREAFNPQLNLFKLTTGNDKQRLYPSTTSFIHGNHLQLYEFVGKMLGKALYEGILVDVPFASFFLNFILQRHHSALYSSIDELPSLDPVMYKNLNFIKTYTGDVSDLQLVFAYDEDVLGKVVTHDLKPGGRAIQVTNANKMTYIHLMARFRLHTQIKEQSAAFIHGFKTIISPEWLDIFSGPELQRLISGDTGSVDLSDLRTNTQYFGGYHASHQTINWLWDILINDFSLEEKKLFLKFVTSCSNPPLLGFAHLEPQFSIRFVDCSEDEDTGDTAGSVVRGLFNIRRRTSTSSTARLPTASTCFNLLKLPSYKKKSILKEKLRYAIKSGAGFELS